MTDASTFVVTIGTSKGELLYESYQLGVKWNNVHMVMKSTV